MKSNSADVVLAPDEYIVRVDVRNGDSMDAVGFITNKRSYGMYGGGRRFVRLLLGYAG